MQKLLSKFKNLLLNKNVLFWYALLVAVFIPLYPKFPLINISGTFVAIRIEDFLVLVLVLWWVIRLVIKKEINKFFESNINLCLLTFFIIGFVSLFSGVFLTKTVVAHLGLAHYFRRIEFMLLLPLFADVIQNRKQLIKILIAFLFTTILINIYALGQQYLNWPLISTNNSEFSKGTILYLTPGARVNSSFAGHYDLAAFLVMFIVISVPLIVKIKKFLFKIILTFSAGFSFFVLVLTAARLSFVAVIVGIILSLVIIKKYWLVILIILLAIGTMAYPSKLRDRFISTLQVSVENKGTRFVSEDPKHQTLSDINIPSLYTPTSSVSAKIQATGAAQIDLSITPVASDIVPGEPTDFTQLEVYRSFAIRTNQEWPRALRAFTKNPLLGTGYSSLGLATDNDFLRVLGEVGLLGLIAITLFFVAVTKEIKNTFSTSHGFYKYLSAGVLAMIVAFLTNALFIDVFEASKVAFIFWIILGVTLSIKNYQHEDN